MLVWRRVVGILLLAMATVKADPVHFSSSGKQVGLLELYTSEGCSSCPPAEEFLSSLVDDPRIFDAFIPLAFHVDYWDYLGWQDRLASASFSERQRNYVRIGAARTVYTPGFFYDGAEWRNFFGGDLQAFPPAAAAGTLTASVTGDRVVVRYDTDPVANNLEAHIALLGFGVETDVRRGENRGRQLKHDFVVLAHAKTVLSAGDNVLGAQFDRPRAAIDVSRTALVAWVQAPAKPPRQATGGYLPN